MQLIPLLDVAFVEEDQGILIAEKPFNRCITVNERLVPILIFISSD
jgi:hypothetical protein